MTNGLPVNSDILTWARKSEGYSLEDLESEFPKLASWESGEEYPSYGRLEALAKKYHRPIAIFFFPEPPEEERIEKSLRAISEEDIVNLSPRVRYLFRKAKSFQLNLKELLNEDQGSQLKKLEWMKSLPRTDMKTLASAVREKLGVTLKTQKSWQDSEDAFRQWRDILAENGVYIFKEAFSRKKPKQPKPNDPIAGFCIYDELFPIIFINNSHSDSKNRQIFTIFHELAHLILKENYLDVFDKRFWELENNDPAHIEVKCNAFASHFLLPNDDFSSQINPDNLNDDIISKMADTYHVSRYVILRRLLDNQAIDSGTYEQKTREWDKQWKSREVKKQSSGGGDGHITKMSYLGNAYLSLVFQRYYQGQISMGQAADYIDIPTKSFSGIEEKFLKRGIL